MSKPCPAVTLLAVLSNPPTTSGHLTLNRVELARQLLGFERVAVVNLFPAPSYRTGELSQLGATPEAWLPARQDIAEQLPIAEGVLLAYGCSAPSGPAREHFRTQERWLTSLLADRSVPVWRVGGTPRHPSRWQRWTVRQHPNLEFRRALSLELATCPAPQAVAPSNTAMLRPKELL